MARQNIQGATLQDVVLQKGISGGYNIELLTAEKALSTEDPFLQFLDPGGATQDVLLPAEADSKGLMFIILNTGAGVENLVVKEDSDTTTIATVTFPEIGLFACDGVTWKGGVMPIT